MDISKITIKQCSLTLGQFDSESVNILVTLFHHQNSSSPLLRLSKNLTEKFENLLTTKKDNDEIYNDTPLTRIELAIMIHFKQTYLSEPIISEDNNQMKSNRIFSIDDELNLAYCFLLAQIDDRVKVDHLDELKFSLGIKGSVESLFDIYEKLHETLPRFFSLVFNCQYFAERLVVVHNLIPAFQLFIKRYEDFIITFEKLYKSLPDNGNTYTQTDAILNQNDTQEIPSPVITKPSSSTPVKQLSNVPISHLIIPPTISSSLNVPRKALCVIINITAFISSQSHETSNRRGSEKDVELIKVVFNKLKFTVLQCNYDFKKANLDEALNHIDDKNQFGEFDCLVMFIMSHGLLHSFFTADSKEVIIRDIVKRYADSSPTTIWRGKPRMFFIQACRSLWPEHIPQSAREGVQQNDLSPRMLVAYSCSASEASRRSPTKGSIFIQILCITILQYGSLYQIQYILDCTRKFLYTLDEQIQATAQRPEYIEREFSTNFRFSNSCLLNKSQSWEYEQRSVLKIPLGIWYEIYHLIYRKPISDRT